jgi:hypothetical protein
MQKEFVPYELAVKLKELGFDMECFGRFYTKPGCKMFSVDEKGRPYPIKNTPKKLYTLGEDFVLNDNNVITAPLFSQAFRWFREKHKIISVIDFTCEGDNWEDVEYNVKLSEIEHFKTHDTFVGHGYKTYEEAELACLDKLIEILEKNECSK